MSIRIAVLGATGVYGRHLVPRLTATGYRIRALVRRPEAAAVPAACGAEVAAADMFEMRDGKIARELVYDMGRIVGENAATSSSNPLKTP